MVNRSAVLKHAKFHPQLITHRVLSSLECTTSLKGTDHMRTWDILCMWTSSKLLLSESYPRGVLAARWSASRLENPQSIKYSFIRTLPMQSCDTSLHRSWPSVHSLSYRNFELIRIIFKKSNEGIFLAEDTYRFPRNLLAAITLADSQSIKCSVDWESANVISPPGYLENY